MGRRITPGATDQSTIIRFLDDDQFTVENSNGPSDVSLWYRRDGGRKIPFGAKSLASLDAAHSDGGFKLISDGYYRVDVPDAAFASGAGGVMVGGTVADQIVIAEYHPLGSYTLDLPVTVLPFSGVISGSGLTQDRRLVAQQFCRAIWSISVYDSDSDPYDCTGLDLAMVVWDANTGAPHEPDFQLRNYDGDSDIAIGGDDGNVLTVTLPPTRTQVARHYRWLLRTRTNPDALAKGSIEVEAAADIT